MLKEELESLVQEVVASATKLRDKYTQEQNAPVNYAAVFAQSEQEYQTLLGAAGGLGRVVEDTPSGPVFALNGFETISGTLKLLKIRMPDTTRPEWGDADFTVRDYEAFKSICLPNPGFKLIERPRMEMIELVAAEFNVKAYFSNTPLIRLLGLE
ncbi:MAG: hypothetical protein U1C53_03080 [Candidatus Veblenbacteria bacterium]|nr:hypothetical protein [Candidatus Veblenbacteria bacterium]